MALDTQATDWEYTGLTEVTAAAGLGGGGYMFMFRSETASIRARVYFLGAGLGLGGSVGPTLAVPDFSGRLSYSSIRCDNAFSLVDLNNSGGRLSSIGVSVLVGYGGISISAFNISTGVLFDNAGGFCLSVGSFGAGATTFAGIWRVGTILT